MSGLRERNAGDRPFYFPWQKWSDQSTGVENGDRRLRFLWLDVVDCVSDFHEEDWETSSPEVQRAILIFLTALALFLNEGRIWVNSNGELIVGIDLDWSFP